MEKVQVLSESAEISVPKHSANFAVPFPNVVQPFGQETQKSWIPFVLYVPVKQTSQCPFLPRC